MQFTCVLMQISPKREQTSTISRFKQNSNSLRQFLKTRDSNELTSLLSMMIVASLLFVFVVHGADIRRATYLCLDCTKNVDKNWNINFIYYSRKLWPCMGRTLSHNLKQNPHYVSRVWLQKWVMDMGVCTMHTRVVVAISFQWILMM